MSDLGHQMHQLCAELFPICRSLTGEGVRETLRRLQQRLPALAIREIPSGTPCFDWRVPREWNIRDAYILAPGGEKIADFKKSNLHVVGYSTPVNQTMDLAALQKHLHSLPDQPDAIPYVTSYYQERWGFCLTHRQHQSLKEGQYHVVIDSTLADGCLNYGELLLPGASTREIFLSTYICHPSMANNELSGPAVTTFLAKYLAGLSNRKYSYRIIFIPETIGSIAYLSLHHQAMKQHIIAGFNITCVGDDRAFSYLPSRRGDTLADQVARHVLKNLQPDYKSYTFLDRGSDERQYCSPGIDLPVCSIMRTKFGEYPEYHTSLDDLNLISPAGLGGAYTALKACLDCLEHNEKLRATTPCEPQLGKRGLYPTLSTKGSAQTVRTMMNLLAYADGESTLLEIAEKIHTPMWEVREIAERLKQEKLLEVV